MVVVGMECNARKLGELQMQFGLMHEINRLDM